MMEPTDVRHGDHRLTLWELDRSRCWTVPSPTTDGYDTDTKKLRSWSGGAADVAHAGGSPAPDPRGGCSSGDARLTDSATDAAGPSPPPRSLCAGRVVEKLSQRDGRDRARNTVGPHPKAPPQRSRAPLALPGKDGTGLDKRQGVVPPPLSPGKPHPEEAIGRTKPRASADLPIHGQLAGTPACELYGPACVEKRGSKGEQSRDDEEQSEPSQSALTSPHRCETSVRFEEDKG